MRKKEEGEDNMLPLIILLIIAVVAAIVILGLLSLIPAFQGWLFVLGLFSLAYILREQQVKYKENIVPVGLVFGSMAFLMLLLTYFNIHFSVLAASLVGTNSYSIIDDSVAVLPQLNPALAIGAIVATIILVAVTKDIFWKQKRRR